MAPPIKFNGLTYIELRPVYRNKPGHKFTMPKGLPELQKPIPVKAIQNVPNTAIMTGLDKVRALRRPLTGNGFSAVVIDTGVFEHENLRGSILKRLSTNGTESDINDNYGHGTHIAGIIAARNSKITSIGIAPGAGIISIKVTNGKSGSASWKSIYKALILTLDLAKKESNSNQKIGVVNISFNGLDAQTDASTMNNHKISEIINELAKHDIPVVVSAGNAFAYKIDDGLGYPAFHETVIAVGAHNNFEFKQVPAHSIAPYSQRYQSNDSLILGLEVKRANSKLIFAPGLCSASLNNSNEPNKQFSVTSGTSMAAAVVSGAILLMQEKWSAENSGRMPLPLLKEKLKAGCEVFRNANYTNPTTGASQVPSRTYDNKNYTKINIFNTLNLI